jgi:transketolase
MFAHEGPVYMRIGNAPIPDLFEPAPFVIGKGKILREGGDMTIISTGAMTAAALRAAELLAERDINPRVVGMPTVSPLDRDLVLDCAANRPPLLTVEEHYVIGGLGTAVQELATEEHPVRVKKAGIPHLYAGSGPYEELLSLYGLDAPGIAAAAEALLRGT